MPLTRKQAWRRVRVRQELAEANDESSPRCSKRAMGDETPSPERQRQQQQQQKEEQQQQQQQQRSPQRAPKGGSAIKSPERKVLDKWRLPKEGREPSARPGVSASKRQAAAACVRVGSRVSFNTVVAAILIPSAKDLHAAARRELWWQETDYREFRMNFIQFMRNPPLAIHDMEVSPDDIPADAATSEVLPEEEEKQMTVEELPQPVMVSAIVYEDKSAPPCDARADKNVRAWAVEGDSEEKEAPTSPSTVSVTSSPVEEIVESDIEARVVAAAATTAADANAFAAASSVMAAAPSAVEVGLSPPASPAATLAVEASEAASACYSPATPELPQATTTLPAVAFDTSDYTVGDEGDGNTVADGGGCWDEQETNRRVQPCLTWEPAVDEQGEEDGEDNTVRVRRSFSNLETARRLGAGQVSAATVEDVMDSDDGGEESVSRTRPRALSLDGWFTCGLENGVETKSYENHDHAGRLRELVKLPMFPAATATPAPPPVSSPKPDLVEAIRQLRVTFNVSVNEKQGAGRMEQRNAGTASSSDDGGDVTHGGETKCRADEDDAVISFPSAATSRNFSDLGAVGSRSIGTMGVGVGGGIHRDYDVCVA